MDQCRNGGTHEERRRRHPDDRLALTGPADRHRPPQVLQGGVGVGGAEPVGGTVQDAAEVVLLQRGGAVEFGVERAGGTGGTGRFLGRRSLAPQQAPQVVLVERGGGLGGRLGRDDRGLGRVVGLGVGRVVGTGRGSVGAVRVTVGGLGLRFPGGLVTGLFRGLVAGLARGLRARFPGVLARIPFGPLGSLAALLVHGCVSSLLRLLLFIPLVSPVGGLAPLGAARAHDVLPIATRRAAMPREPYALTEPTDMPSVSAAWASVMSAK